MIIQKKNAKWLIYFNIVVGMFVWFFISVFSFPKTLEYVLDVDIALLAALLLIYYGRGIRHSHSFWPIFFIVALFISTLIGWGINNQSIFHYIWGFRNNFRYLIFFIGCIVFLDMKDVEYFIFLCEKLFPINLILCTIQFLMGKKQDYLGGMYGVMSGCNALLNVYLCVVVCYTLLQMLEGKKKINSIIYVILGAVYIAALGELKVFFIELVVILLLAFFMSKPSIKSLVMIIFSCGFIVLGITLIGEIYPYFKDFFTLEGMMKYAGSGDQGYSSKYDINRLNAFNRIYDYFLKGDLTKTLFGIGLGEADTSSISIFNTSFYKQYRTLHYTWFSSSMMLLENGIVGVILYISFFISILLYSIKGCIVQKSVYYKMTIIIVVMCIIQFFYNCYLRYLNSSSFIYLFLAIPFIYAKEKGKIDEDMGK